MHILTAALPRASLTISDAIMHPTNLGNFLPYFAWKEIYIKMIWPLQNQYVAVRKPKSGGPKQVVSWLRALDFHTADLGSSPRAGGLLCLSFSETLSGQIEMNK